MLEAARQARAWRRIITKKLCPTVCSEIESICKATSGAKWRQAAKNRNLLLGVIVNDTRRHGHSQRAIRLTGNIPADLPRRLNCSPRTVHNNIKWLREHKYIKQSGEQSISNQPKPRPVFKATKKALKTRIDDQPDKYESAHPCHCGQKYRRIWHRSGYLDAQCKTCHQHNPVSKPRCSKTALAAWQNREILNCTHSTATNNKQINTSDKDNVKRELVETNAESKTANEVREYLSVMNRFHYDRIKRNKRRKEDWLAERRLRNAAKRWQTTIRCQKSCGNTVTLDPRDSKPNRLCPECWREHHNPKPDPMLTLDEEEWAEALHATNPTPDTQHRLESIKTQRNQQKYDEKLREINRQGWLEITRTLAGKHTHTEPTQPQPKIIKPIETQPKHIKRIETTLTQPKCPTCQAPTNYPENCPDCKKKASRKLLAQLQANT